MIKIRLMLLSNYDLFIVDMKKTIFSDNGWSRAFPNNSLNMFGCIGCVCTGFDLLLEAFFGSDQYPDSAMYNYTQLVCTQINKCLWLVVDMHVPIS